MKNLIKCYTDGSKINGRVGAGYYIVYPDNSKTMQDFFYLGIHSSVFQAEVFVISQLAKKLDLDET